MNSIVKVLTTEHLGALLPVPGEPGGKRCLACAPLRFLTPSTENSELNLKKKFPLVRGTQQVARHSLACALQLLHRSAGSSGHGCLATGTWAAASRLAVPAVPLVDNPGRTVPVGTYSFGRKRGLAHLIRGWYNLFATSNGPGTTGTQRAAGSTIMTPAKSYPEAKTQVEGLVERFDRNRDVAFPLTAAGAF